jgi:hypothetical protein
MPDEGRLHPGQSTDCSHAQIRRARELRRVKRALPASGRIRLAETVASTELWRYRSARPKAAMY